MRNGRRDQPDVARFVMHVDVASWQPEAQNSGEHSRAVNIFKNIARRAIYTRNTVKYWPGKQKENKLKY